MKRLCFALLCIVFVCISCSSNSNQPLEVNEFSFYNPLLDNALSILEPTLENTVSLLDYAVIGEIDDLLIKDTNMSFYRFRVIDQLFGEKITNDLIITTHYAELDVGSTYLLFLNFEQFTTLPFDFYYATPFWLLKVENNRVRLLTDTRDNTYLVPFKDDKYNQLPHLTEYIIQLHQERPPSRNEKDPFIETASFEELVDLSDFIGIIRVEVTIPLMLGSVSADEYEIISTYKSPSAEMPSLLVLPAGIEAGQEYLVFIQGISPTARHGSVFSKTDAEFDSFLERLQDLDLQ